MASSVVTPEIVNSTSDMLDMAPADLFEDGGTDTSVDDSSGADSEVVDDGSSELADPGAITSEEPTEEQTEAEEQGEEELPVAAATAAAPTVDLPEGVTAGKNKAGKDGLFVEKSRWENAIYPAHKLVNEVSKALGEPATLETLSERIKSADALELMYSDITSGDTGGQTAVINHLIDRMENAYRSGETGVDPAVTFAQSVYSTLKQRSPEAYATLRLSQARDFLGEMFELAAERGDTALFNSAQHFVRALTGVNDGAQLPASAKQFGLPYYEPAQMSTLKQSAANDPVARLQQENQALRQRLNGGQNGPAQQFSQWQAEATNFITKAVTDEAILPALANWKAAQEKRPDDFRRLAQEPLHREVLANLKADPVFQQRLKKLDAEARRATSADVRAQIRERMKQTYVNRAKLAVEAVKGPILKTAATALADGAASTHARRQAAQSQTAPKGAGTTAPRSLVPTGTVKKIGDTYSPESAMQEMLALFGG